MIIKQTLKLAAAKLSAHGLKLPRLEAEILLSAILKKPREFLLAHGERKLTASQISNFKLKISRRLGGEPVAYLTGHKEFYGLDFIVNKNVLIPRPETELMVEEALKLVTHDSKPCPSGRRAITLIDLGTGSGCVAITLTKLTKQKLMAIDISKKALAVAKQNAKLHGVAKNIKFFKGDLLEPLLNSKFVIRHSSFVILANLPYLDSKWKKLLKSSDSLGLKFEPKVAIAGGADGLSLYRKLAKQIKSLKKLNLTLLCEIGHLHGPKMKKIFSFAKKIQIKKDLSGLNRLAIIKIA